MTENLATAQELVDEAVERKGVEFIEENFEAYFKPAKILGHDIDREDVEIRESESAE